MASRNLLTERTDLELVQRARDGEDAAFAELWRRHARAVAAAARGFTNAEAEDVAQETFLRILQRVRAGHGPTSAFRPYAIATARNVAVSVSRCRTFAEIPMAPEESHLDRPTDDPDVGERVLGGRFTRGVFQSLPASWQRVLWYRDVDDLSVGDIAARLGLSENAASALLRRAREGFKRAWIGAHLNAPATLPAECRRVIVKLPAHARGGGTVHARARVKAHLHDCTRCAPLAEESEHLQKRLALALLPLLAAGGAALAPHESGATSAGSGAARRLALAGRRSGRSLHHVGWAPAVAACAGGLVVLLLGVLPSLAISSDTPVAPPHRSGVDAPSAQAEPAADPAEETQDPQEGAAEPDPQLPKSASLTGAIDALPLPALLGDRAPLPSVGDAVEASPGHDVRGVDPPRFEPAAPHVPVRQGAELASPGAETATSSEWLTDCRCGDELAAPLILRVVERTVDDPEDRVELNPGRPFGDTGAHGRTERPRDG